MKYRKYSKSLFIIKKKKKKLKSAGKEIRLFNYLI